MLQINFSFDPNGGIQELKDLFDLFHRYYPQIPEDPAKISDINTEVVKKKDERIKELEKLVKKHENENVLNIKKISDLNESLEEKNKYIELLEEEDKKKEKEIKRINEANELKYYEIKSKYEADKEVLIKEKDKQITSLREENNNLSKKIKIYEPSLNGDVSSDKYFNIDKTLLNETMADDAPFIGKVDANGNALFQFNSAKGPHKQYAQSQYLLENFCEIIESVEGANHISPDQWGKATYINGTMGIKTKAKIKLTRE